MFRAVSILVFLFLVFRGVPECAAEEPQPFEKGKTGVTEIDSLPVHEWDIRTGRNSLPLTLLWGIFPGGGQFYSEHYVRGSFIAAVELLLTYEVFFNKKIQKERRFDEAREFQDSIAVITNHILSGVPGDSLTYYQQKRGQFVSMIRSINDKKIEEEDLRKSELTWLIGLHLYGWMDAFGIWKKNRGYNLGKRSVSSALLRSIVPGWGQIYNDEYGKAGLLYMGLLGSSVSVYSRQQVVRYYLGRVRNLRGEPESSVELEEVNERLTYFRKNRNLYIWGFALIYLYSIGDAVVDAMLSDFDNPVHLAFVPDIRGGLQALFRFDF
ncbi:MAG: DUF5683 domain-containing protein [Fibrobacter sp.]|jgi:hypothetical protein|nr:DUF5683 domain-containing protein [Fibrobacter sp.]